MDQPPRVGLLGAPYPDLRIAEENLSPLRAQIILGDGSMAWYTEESQAELRRSAEGARRILLGGTPLNPVVVPSSSNDMGRRV